MLDGGAHYRQALACGSGARLRYDGSFVSERSPRAAAVTESAQIAAVSERLRGDGIDVIRVSYPDMIGIDRGRDVLLDELASVADHGLAFCRAVYHTSPMGDVVPVQGGLESGLPDITVYPDLSTLTPLPWEPHAAWCLGNAMTTDGQPAPESPRTAGRVRGVAPLRRRPGERLRRGA